ncbi:MAG: hypothetical protein ACF8PN_04650 [Phycisphaerales bacterium]
MVGLNRIERLVSAAHFHQLLDDIVANGRPVGMPVKVRLSDPSGQPAASIGLGLQRAAELTWRLSPAVENLVDRLLESRNASSSSAASDPAGDPNDGGFGTVAATAVAVRALFAVRDLPGAARIQGRLDAAIDAALWWLALRQEVSSGRIGDDIDSVIVLWQLQGAGAGAPQAGDARERIGAALRLADLAAAVEDADLRVDELTPALLDLAA